jgi:hypothetical protein
MGYHDTPIAPFISSDLERSEEESKDLHFLPVDLPNRPSTPQRASHSSH